MQTRTTIVHVAALVAQLAIVGMAAARIFGGGVGTAIAVTVVAGASLGLHELGHYHAARRHGVGGIRVGVSWYGAYTVHDDTDDSTAAADMAARGILYNVVAAVAAWVLHLVAGGDVARVLIGGAWFNAGLAALNAIPALPFDGGRIMMALLGRRRLRRRLSILNATVGFAGVAALVAGAQTVGVGVIGVGAIGTVAALRTRPPA